MRIDCEFPVTDGIRNLPGDPYQGGARSLQIYDGSQYGPSLPSSTLSNRG